MTQSVAAEGFVALVADLAGYLTGDVNPDEIVSHLGAWAPGESENARSLVPAEVQTVSPYVARAGVARFPDSEVPYAVTLVPIDEARPTVAAMRTAFGEPRVGAAGPDLPTELQFVPAGSSGVWRIVIVAWAQRRGPDLHDAVVAQLLLRRDSLA